jgi:hypothetical protein
MADADRPAPRSKTTSTSTSTSPRRKKPAGPSARKAAKSRRAAAAPDPLEADFGPGFDPDPDAAAREQEAARTTAAEAAEAAEAAAAGSTADGRWTPPAPGFFPGVACGGETCLLNPFANLLGKFGLRLVRGRGASLSRVAFSSIELMRALRDFLDEEIALAEKASGGGAAPRYEKIPVD